MLSRLILAGSDSTIRLEIREAMLNKMTDAIGGVLEWMFPAAIRLSSNNNLRNLARGVAGGDSSTRIVGLIGDSAA
jgi:hypothetical protein